MIVSLGALVSAFLITFIIIKTVKPIACSIGLVDKPGGRKRHDGLIPLVGGIAIFGGVFATAYLFVGQPLFIRMFMLGCGFLVFMGALDDRYQLSARVRLVGQFIVACIFVYGLEGQIYSFGNLLGMGEITIGWLGFPIAILALIGVTNAFNMLDGMDGLVGGIGVVSFLGMLFLFGMAGDASLSLLCTAFVGAISAFLIFNLRGGKSSRLSKIFMGDAGSMYLGLAVGVLLIHGSQSEAATFPPITALWFVLLPITDMFTIVYRRLKRGRSPMAPDRTHIHHLLLRAGFTPMQTLNLMVACQGILVTIGILTSLSNHSEAISFVGIIVFVVAYQFLMRRSWRLIRWNKRRFA